MINNPSKILVIKSDPSELKNVEVFVNELFQEYNIHKNHFNKVYLCISEAVVNSIKHGNRNDKNKTVSIIVNYNSTELNIEIKDEGDGFKLKYVKDPTKSSNIRSESGRGILIIKSLSEQIEYNKKGNSIHFKIDCK